MSGDTTGANGEKGNVFKAAVDGVRELQLGGRQIRYLGQFVQLEEKGMSRLSVMAILIISGIVTAFLIWATFIQIDEVAATSGAVVPKSNVHVVQHLEGGIVADVLVSDREMVEKGQPLARLDPVQARAELEQVEARRMSLKLRAERLRAVAGNRMPDFSFVPDSYAHMVADHMELFEASMDRWNTQAAVIRGEVEQKRAEIAAAERQLTATRNQLDLLRQEVDMQRTLFEQGHASKVRFFESRRAVSAMESELSRLEGQRNTAMKALIELRERRADLDSNTRQDALGEMGTVTAELAQVEETIGRLSDQVNRLTVVSPARGFVQNLQVRNSGAVIPAGGMLMEVVPVDDELLVETRISTRDVGHVKSGQPVKVKVTSYDFVRYGAIPGRLETVSATTYVDEQDGQPYYKGMVALDRQHMGETAEQDPILPGMTVQADIVTGSKTLLQYLLKPIHVSMSQAFHER